MPFSSTVAPLKTVWLGPAYAVGGRTPFVVMVTVDGTLSFVPLFTISCATYVPERPALNVGIAAVALLSVAPLPEGTDRRLHR